MITTVNVIVTLHLKLTGWEKPCDIHLVNSFTDVNPKVQETKGKVLGYIKLKIS